MEYQKLLDSSENWLKYAIQINLLHQSKEDLSEQRKAALTDCRIRNYLDDIVNFHSTLIKNHKNPELPINKLLFLLDVGFDTDVPEVKTAIDLILKHQDNNGVYQSLINIPKHFGGTGEDMFTWCLCDAPLLLLALLKAGLDYKKYIEPGVDYLASFCRDNGFPCAASPELGKFRGPGKKDDCCPYATLLLADLFSYIPEYKNSPVTNAAVSALLSLWENSLERHPYLFYMGTDFRKLKAPSCWYDIVSVSGVLSKFQFAQNDPRFMEMITLIKNKQDSNGFFTPESIYQKLKGWDFGQKKAPSPYLTYLCLCTFGRLQ